MQRNACSFKCAGFRGWRGDSLCFLRGFRNRSKDHGSHSFLSDWNTKRKIREHSDTMLHPNRQTVQKQHWPWCLMLRFYNKHTSVNMRGCIWGYQKDNSTRTFSLILSCLRLRHISVVLMCCSVSLASRKQSFSSLGAADAQAAAPNRSLSSSICFNIPEDVQNSLHETLKPLRTCKQGCCICTGRMSTCWATKRT